MSTTVRPAPAWRAWLRPAIGLLALLALGVALSQPIWVAELDAPQYPKGLRLEAYGDRIAGDVNEVNGLNHYVGMRTIDPAIIPEMRLWPLAPISSAVLVLVALAFRGWPSILARVGLWLVPLVILADIQRWLMFFGRELDKEAALRLKPFVPLVIGPTTVWNFRIWAMPGTALLILLGVALAVTLAVRAGPRPGRPSGFARAAAGPVAALLVLVLGACGTPAAQPAHGGHDDAPAALPAPGSAAREARSDALPQSAFDLRAAIAATAPGGELLVPAGRYRGPLVLDKPITLAAAGPVVLDGGGHGAVVEIRAPSVTVRGFEIHWSGGQIEDGAGVTVLAENATIEGNSFHHVYVGVLARGARDLHVVDNLIEGPGYAGAQTGLLESHHESGIVGDGISLWNIRGALVRDNTVIGMRDGIFLSYTEEILVDRNLVTTSRYGLHGMFASDLTIFGNEMRNNAAGLVLMNGSTVQIGRNLLVGQRSSATGYGILLKDVRGARVLENVAMRNVVGLRADGVEPGETPAEVVRNDFSYNGVGVQLLPSSPLVFSRNSFIDNTVQVDLGSAPRAGGTWTKTGLGNYWSGYGGFDVADDGMGDIAHREGTAAARLLQRAPELLALRGSLAMSVLARAERWWDLNRTGSVIDPLPLSRPLAPAPAPLPAGSGAPWALAGTALLGAVGALALLARRPHQA